MLASTRREAVGQTGTVIVGCQAVLFDNDGVLVDSHMVVESAWRQLAGELGVDPSALLDDAVGVRSIDVLRNHVAPSKLSEVVARFENIEVSLAGGVRSLPGAIRLLGSLGNVPWAVVTYGSLRLASARWHGAGIPAPPFAITADDVAHGKPHPDPYLRAAEGLGVAPAACVVFEDSPSGGISAQEAGCTVVAVGDQPWWTRPHARVADLRAVTLDTADDDASVQVILEESVGP